LSYNRAYQDFQVQGMNILFLLNTDVSPSAAGGDVTMVHTLAQALTGLHGCNISLAFFDRHPTPSPIRNKIPVAPYDKNRFEAFLLKNRIDRIIVSVLSRQNTRLLPDIYGLAHKHGIKVIQWFHMMPGYEMANYGSLARLWFAVKARKHLSVHSRRLVLTWLRALIRPAARLYLRPKYRLLYDHCDACVLLSPHFIPGFMGMAGRKTAKCSAIGNAATFEHDMTAGALAQKRKEVLIVSRLDESTKRLSLALKIWRKIERESALKDWTLTVVGSGDDMAYYQYLSRKLKLQRCAFEGRQPSMPYFKRASLFMMTSACEGFPLTLGEALQMGAVPLAFDSFGAVRDIIRHGHNGLLIPNNDVNTYAAQLSRLMHHEALRRTMAQHAAESARQFALPEVMKKWKELLLVEDNQ
jgi:glycosyltransferase involved in cell wall biosynthesis